MVGRCSFCFYLQTLHCDIRISDIPFQGIFQDVIMFLSEKSKGNMLKLSKKKANRLRLTFKSCPTRART